MKHILDVGMKCFLMWEPVSGGSVCVTSGPQWAGDPALLLDIWTAGHLGTACFHVCVRQRMCNVKYVCMCVGHFVHMDLCFLLTGQNRPGF